MRFRAVEQPQKFAFQGEFSDYDDGEEQMYTELCGSGSESIKQTASWA